MGQAATQIANWEKARVIGADTTSVPIPGTEAVVNTKTETLGEGFGTNPWKRRQCCIRP